MIAPFEGTGGEDKDDRGFLNKFDLLLALRSKRWGCLKQCKGSALEK